MAEWIYSPEDWARTREVKVGQDPDGLWRWWRVRTGPDARVVGTCTSGGFTDAKWMYRNAVKENVGLDVPVPEGVEQLMVIQVPLEEVEVGEMPADEVEVPDADVEPAPPGSEEPVEGEVTPEEPGEGNGS